MEKFQKLLHRIVPVLCCLVLVISLFPTVPASAEDAAGEDPPMEQPGLDDSAAYVITSVSGVWLLNETVSLTSELSNVPVNFTCNGTSFKSIDLTPIDVLAGTKGVLKYCSVSGSRVTVCTSTSGWTSEFYRTLDFGAEPQIVWAVLSSWLEANATYVGESTPKEYTYRVQVGTNSFTYTTTSDSIDLDMVVSADGYRIQVDGYEEDYYIRDEQMSGSTFQYVGLSASGVYDEVQYPVGSYTLTLTADNPNLNLDPVYKYPLFIDPNGGTWNGLAEQSVFWDFPTADIDNIVDPVRSGYTFTGWSVSGSGEFWTDEYPYSYTYEDGAGYLTANWTEDTIIEPDPDPVDPTPDPDPDPDPDPGTGLSYSHTIFIAGESFVFTSSTGAPAVTIYVLPDRVQLKSGSDERFWYYSGSASFLGIRDKGTNTFHEINAYFSVLGANGSNKVTTFVVELGGHELPLFYTTVYIDGLPFRFSAVDTSPDVTVTVHSTYVSLTDGVTTLTFTPSDIGFLGLASTPDGTVVCPDGLTISVLGKNSSDTAHYFFSCYEEKQSDDPLGDIRVDFVSWLKDAAGAFLSFEIYPGLSLDEIVYFILVVQLLLWFLRVVM